MNRFTHWIAALVFATTIGGAALATITPQTAAAAPNCESRLLTLPTWYRGLTDEKCNIVYPGKSGESVSESRKSLSDFIWTIALNIVEIMLHLVGYAAVGFIIYGGFVYLTSSGQPDKISGAKRTIMNAVVGLIISIFAIGIVNTVVGAF